MNCKRTEILAIPESEVEPTHIWGLPALPEVYSTLVVILQLLWLCFTFPIHVFWHINWNPVAAKEHITIVAVEMACNKETHNNCGCRNGL